MHLLTANKIDALTERLREYYTGWAMLIHAADIKNACRVLSLDEEVIRKSSQKADSSLRRAAAVDVDAQVKAVLSVLARGDHTKLSGAQIVKSCAYMAVMIHELSGMLANNVPIGNREEGPKRDAANLYHLIRDDRGGWQGVTGEVLPHIKSLYASLGKVSLERYSQQEYSSLRYRLLWSLGIGAIAWFINTTLRPYLGALFDNDVLSAEESIATVIGIATAVLGAACLLIALKPALVLVNGLIDGISQWMERRWQLKQFQEAGQAQDVATLLEHFDAFGVRIAPQDLVRIATEMYWLSVRISLSHSRVKGQAVRKVILGESAEEEREVDDPSPLQVDMLRKAEQWLVQQVQGVVPLSNQSEAISAPTKSWPAPLKKEKPDYFNQGAAKVQKWATEELRKQKDQMLLEARRWTKLLNSQKDQEVLKIQGCVTELLCKQEERRQMLAGLLRKVDPQKIGLNIEQKDRLKSAVERLLQGQKEQNEAISMLMTDAREWLSLKRKRIAVAAAQMSQRERTEHERIGK